MENSYWGPCQGMDGSARDEKANTSDNPPDPESFHIAILSRNQILADIIHGLTYAYI